jgi:acyl-CoA hydrolase
MNDKKEEVKTTSNKEFCYRQLVLQKELGFGDALFGGEMLGYIDKASAAYLMIKTGTSFLRTVNMQVDFVAPVFANEIIDFFIEITRIGNTSISAEMDIMKVDVENEKMKLMATAKMTFVRVDNRSEARQISESFKNKIKEKLNKKSQS